MRFAEVNPFGVYVAPTAVMMVAAWGVTISLRPFAVRFGLLRMSGTPRCSCSPVSLIVLSSIVLAVAVR